MLLLGCVPVAVAAAPVEFQFAAPANPAVRNTFARALSAVVITPSGQRLPLPAFFVGDRTFAVRARPDQRGEYQIERVLEVTGGREVAIAVRFVSPREVEVRQAEAMPAVGRDPAMPSRFHTADGRPFVPIGANVAWAEGPVLPYYQRAFAAFSRERLNWMRIWMAHWGRLNLDWLPGPSRFLPAPMGASPSAGNLDPRVAANWDRILALAEQHGVYVQVVLQHHGQYSTQVNPNWAENPWNAANPGGFLKTPTDFFTSPRARELTQRKYRYIVARWGWSPAVFAWELFNEVHWVDAMRNGHEAAVAAWHDEMADFIRSVDAYHHLVTTSTEDLRSPIYAKMDFYQPHLYAADAITGARRVLIRPPRADRPVFYGEEGDDHLDLPEAVKRSGVAIVPPAWAALMGETRLPAQPWLGWTLLGGGRLAELGAVERFVAGTGFAAREHLEPFAPLVESATRQPLVLAGCQLWRDYTPPEIEVPLDGRMPVDWAAVPRIYAGRDARDGGVPRGASFVFDYPRAATLRARIVGMGKGSGGIRFRLDRATVAEKAWSADAPDRPSPERPTVVEIPMPVGPHTLRIENTGAGEWVEVAGLDLGVEAPVLAGLGQRSDRFIAVWVFNRAGLYAPGKPAAARGTVVIDGVAAGDWTVTWWDTLTGTPLGPPQVLHHPGGTLRIATPPIARHAAVVLTR